jgi:orotidine-5'-phosphate decarboxylase
MLLGEGFIKKYYNLSKEKCSFLCAGLDPVTDKMRSRYIIPPKLIQREGIVTGIKRFCIDIIKAVSDYTAIIKPNAQFITYALSFNDLKELTQAIHEEGCLAILDAKLTDIGSTNSVGLHWIDAAGFDAVTFSPYPGYQNGTDAIYEWSRRNEKGIFALCRMSNLGGNDYQSGIFQGEPFYIRVAKDAYERGCNGYVVGCTVPNELGQVRKIIGDEGLILAPGLGLQGGDPTTALRMGANSQGDALIVSSSRSINYAYEDLRWNWEKYAKAAAVLAKRKRDELNEIKKKAFS